MTAKQKKWWGAVALLVIGGVVTLLVNVLSRKDVSTPPIVVNQTQTQVVQQPEAKSTETGATVEPPVTNPANKKSRTQKKGIPDIMPTTIPVPATVPPSIEVNAPGGIAIGGGTVTNPVVNNYGPAPPPKLKINFSTSDASDNGHPYEQAVLLTVNVTMSPVRIILVCDSPVEFVDFRAREMVFTDVHYGSKGNTAFLSYDSPPLTPNNQLEVVLAAKQPFKVLSVEPIGSE